MRGIEDRQEVSNAMRDWKNKFGVGAERSVGRNGETLWQSKIAMWGIFNQWERENGTTRYWNAFGVSLTRLKQNIVVEINPPDSGINPTMQGVLAHATPNGPRWVLHRGRMAIPGRQITETDFANATSLQPVAVHFSNNNIFNCYPVANIDQRPAALQEDIASFVRECHRIRLLYSLGIEAAAQEASVDVAESTFPELMGSYPVSGHDATVANRQHGRVWHALVNLLTQREVRHTNSRVGRWGPDLRTVADNPVLFEIKVTNIAGDLQRAVGQLFLYEKLLKQNHRKVLVLPNDVGGILQEALQNLKVDILTFSVKQNNIIINPQQIDAYLR